MLHDCCICSMCYHYIISIFLWYDIIVVTRLLRMIYVLWLVLDGNSSREDSLLLSSYEHLCDRYSIYLNITCIFMTLHTMYF